MPIFSNILQLHLADKMGFISEVTVIVFKKDKAIQLHWGCGKDFQSYFF